MLVLRQPLIQIKFKNHLPIQTVFHFHIAFMEKKRSSNVMEPHNSEVVGGASIVSAIEQAFEILISTSGNQFFKIVFTNSVLRPMHQ